MISDALAGKRLAITGTTGFLGTALVERLLRCVPEVELVLLVRPGRRGVEQRIRREIIRNDVFDRLREELGNELGLSGEEQLEALRRRLRAMERDGQLVFTRRQCYALPERLDLLRGTVIGHR